MQGSARRRILTLWYPDSGSTFYHRVLQWKTKGCDVKNADADCCGVSMFHTEKLTVCSAKHGCRLLRSLQVSHWKTNSLQWKTWTPTVAESPRLHTEKRVQIFSVGRLIPGRLLVVILHVCNFGLWRSIHVCHVKRGNLRDLCFCKTWRWPGFAPRRDPRFSNTDVALSSCELHILTMFSFNLRCI